MIPALRANMLIQTRHDCTCEETEANDGSLEFVPLALRYKYPSAKAANHHFLRGPGHSAIQYRGVCSLPSFQETALELDTPMRHGTQREFHLPDHRRRITVKRYRHLVVFGTKARKQRFIQKSGLRSRDELPDGRPQDRGVRQLRCTVFAREFKPFGIHECDLVCSVDSVNIPFHVVLHSSCCPPLI